MTYDRLQEKGATQLLYAYSPGTEPKDSTNIWNAIREMILLT